MIWLTWHQFRFQAAMMAAALAVFAAILALTGPGLADDYSSGIAACSTQSGGCSDFAQRFFQDNRGPFLAVTAVVLVLPALIGLFWGAPLITRELEAGTHRLVWNQSITRTRWLAVKLGLVGVAAVITAGLGSLAVDWWSGPIDKAASDFPRMEPLLFGARGIVPVGYAAFAFVLGVTAGMLIRRTLPAMATTLAVFVVVQIAMPQLVRPHLAAPTRSIIAITTASLDQISAPRGGGPIQVRAKAPDTGAYDGAWVLSSQTIDKSGHAVDSISTLSRGGPCGPPQEGSATQPTRAQPGGDLSGCLAEIKRRGYRQRVSYHPAGRFWSFQSYETGIYTALSLGLAGFCFWRIRRRLS